MNTDTTARFLENDGKITLASDLYQYTFGYYSRNPWVSDDICVMARAIDFDNREEKPQLAAVNFADRTVTYPYESNAQSRSLSAFT